MAPPKLLHRCPDCGRGVVKETRQGGYHCQNSECFVISVWFKRRFKGHDTPDVVKKIVRAAVL